MRSAVENWLMSAPRVLAPPHLPIAHYHCISRVVDRQFIFGPEEKNLFLSLMEEYSQFCGVRVISYCVMGNHFHLTVEVPKPPENLTGHDWLLERLDVLTVTYPVASDTRKKITKFLADGAFDQLQELVDGYKALMWDLSSFMKMLKQRFTMRYNKAHERKGTLWESRFKSTLIEGAGDTLGTVSAYIDLNPVRAGIVEDPAKYPWSSYGKACQGDEKAMAGIRTVVAGTQRVEETTLTLEEGLKTYRGLLIGNSAMDVKPWETSEAAHPPIPARTEGPGEGPEVELRVTGDLTPVRLGPTKAEILEKVMADEQVPLPEYVRIRVRYFADGVVLGSKEFVGGIIEAYRDRFGRERIKGGSRLRGLNFGEGVYSLRNLKTKVFG
jgi:putative transposase